MGKDHIKLQGPVSDEPRPENRIVSLDEARARRAAQDRRDFERFFLGEMVQVFCVDVTGEYFPVEIVEASLSGCSFRVPFELAQRIGAEPKGRSLQLRFYLSHETYLPVSVQVTNASPLVEEGCKFIRFGCAVETEHASYAAYQQLVLFIDAVSRASRRESRRKAV